MKKIFTLFFALFMMVFCAKAQYFLQEGFEGSTLPTGWTIVDSDGDNYNWDMEYWSATSTNPAHTGSNCIASASYINNIGALTPDNWLISPAVNLTSNATLTFWVADYDYAEPYTVYISTTTADVSAFTTVLTQGTTSGAAFEYEEKTVDLSAYTGQTVYIAFRHYNCTDNYWLFLDDVEIFAQPTDPTITANVTSIDFGTIAIPGNGVETATITAYNLTAGITATTAAPFSVSANGTTYGTTATIAQTGGTLYMKYTPTSAGPANGTVTLASTGATNVTIALTGTAVDCSNNPLPYTTDFTNEALNNCWTISDANNDGYTFEYSASGYAYYSYSEDDAANDWLISPVFTIPATGATASFDYATGGFGTESYSVHVIAAGQTTQVLATQNVSNTSWETQYIDLTAYANQSIQVAIKCESAADQYLLGFTNFFIGEDIPTTMTVTPTAIDFGSIPAGMTVENAIIINSANLNEAINVTTAAPYSVSLNGTTYNTTVTIPANPALSVADTIYVKFAPTAAGSFDGYVTISTSTISDTVSLTGTAVDCDVVTTFPFTEDFDDNSATRACWTINDANNDGKTFTFYDGAARYSYSTTNPANDWLISPEITFTGSQLLSVDYRAQSASYPEKFMIAAINGTTTTLLTDTIDVTLTTYETEYVDLSSLNGTYRIGIHCVSDANQWNLFIDNFVINDIAEASLSVAPDSIAFIGIMGQASAAQEVAVTGLALTSSISVSAPANFEVSADNTTFGATATIANTGLATQASLYVRYNPATAGAHTSTITLTSGTATASVYVEGNAVDCSNGIASLPFTHDFNDAVVPPLCWGYNDASHMGAITIEEGDYGAAFAAVDYLITPEIHSTLPMSLSLDYQTLAGLNDISSSSTFRIGYSSTDDNYGSFTWLAPVVANQIDENFFNYTSLFPAGTKYVAIDVTEIGTFTYGMSSYYNYMIFDNFSLTEVSNPEISAGTTSIDFGNIHVGDNATETVAIAGALLTTDITATTTAPFEVSADNTTFGATATIPAAGGNLYVRYAPTAAGNHTGNVTLASTGATSVTISLAGRAIDCSSAATLPFFEGFESELSECWTLIDADGDGHNWYILNNSQSSQGGFNIHSGEGHITSASYASGALTPDNWLITPAINLSENATLSFWVAGQDPNYAAENFSVYLSTSGTNIDNFNVTLFENQTSTADMTEYTADLSAYTGNNVHIAFRHHNVTDMFRLNLDDVSITAGVGIADAENNNVSVYPNPANNVINVNSTSNISNVEIYTITGQKVGDFTANSNHTAISTSNLTNGLYLMRIHTENGVINKKFSVVR
ncbi:MAG: choice-of-anchor J domain-containing protein [Bacteroidales bacterium]|nr:choice-of-anchor J domain-containing protein [Bacteroidales bacterium]